MKLKGIRVLVIEDVPDIRDVFVILLRAEGADVTSTGSGLEGADLAQNGRFDIILSDLGLPDIAGDLLIRKIRTSVARGTRVLVITGYGEPYVTRAKQAGADAVFTKPVEWTEVLDFIRRPDLAASA